MTDRAERNRPPYFGAIDERSATAKDNGKVSPQLAIAIVRHDVLIERNNAGSRRKIIL